ncbi:MAG: hypothetical protein NVS9B4_21440 [Candidatus Acidiferrum sp.]
MLNSMRPLRSISCVPLCVFLSLCLLAPAFAAKKKPPIRPVNINTAKSEELQQVPGIGPSTADKILQMRKSYGTFKTVDDLLAIRGLGPKRLDKMRKYLSVGKPQAAAQAVPAKAPKQKSPPQKAAPTTSSATSTKAGAKAMANTATPAQQPEEQ